MNRLKAAPTRLRSTGAQFRAHVLSRRWGYSDSQLSAVEHKHARMILTAARKKPAYRHLKIGEQALADPVAFIHSLPVLRKEEVRGREEAFWSGSFTFGAATSGTTGTPLRLRRSMLSVVEEEAWVSHWRSWAGFRQGDRVAELRGALVHTSSGGVPHEWNSALQKLSLSSYHLSPETLGQYLELIRLHRIEWINAYPSSVTALASLARREGLALPAVRGIFTSSESLTPENREHISASFGCEVWDHYGNAERTVAASQCSRSRYHLLPGYALVEQADPAAPGFVTTNLTNLAMPLLNYEVTDSLEGWSSDPCDCGRRGPTISRVHGRNEDFLVGERGRLVGRMDHVFKGLPGAAAGQFHQREQGHVTVRVVPSSDRPHLELTKAVEALTRTRLGSIEVDVEIVDQLTPGANGKAPFVIQDLDVAVEGA